MSNCESCPKQKIPAWCSGMWVAWNREQTHILAACHTFEEAKQTAANAGHREIVITKIAPQKHRSAYSQAIVYAVAVFVAQVIPVLSSS